MHALKTHHKILIAVGVGVGVYLLYVNWNMFLGAQANTAMGGFDFGVLDPSNWDTT